MAGRHLSGFRIRQQHWSAIGAADPETLTTGIAHQAIGLGPGLRDGLTRRQHQRAVDLLGTVDADARADITGQHIRASALPLAGEEAMFKGLQQIRLEVIAPVATDPGPAL